MIILALDPGGTTGWAKCTLEEVPDSIDAAGNLHVKRRGVFSWGQMGPHSHHLELQALLETAMSETQELHLVTESFQFRQFDGNRTGVVLVSVEYIGVARLFALQHPDRVLFTQQTPAEAKGFVTDVKIKKLDLWTPGLPHAMDAMRHLIYYQVARLQDYSYVHMWKPTPHQKGPEEYG